MATGMPAKTLLALAMALLPTVAAAADAAPGRGSIPAQARAAQATAAKAPAAQAIPVHAFNDGINHWRSGHGNGYARLETDDVRGIADAIVLLQRDSGGWAVNRDPLRVLDAAARRDVIADKASAGGSFDNRTGYTHVAYLAAAHARTGDERYSAAALHGLDFILDQQISSCGGWPHSVPSRTSYHGHITFADDVTAGVLAMLRRSLTAPEFGFVDAPRRARIASAVERGDACLLRLQVRQQGRPTIWAAQYDATTLRPAQGRAFELPSLVTDESVGVVRYLMSIDDPSPEVAAAVEGALAWFQANALHGVRLETFEAAPEQFAHHRSTVDRRLVADPDAPPLWGRFHDLADNTVVLADRQGRRLQAYSQVTRERRTGYHWYGQWPRALLDRDAAQWRQRVQAAPPAAGSTTDS